MQITINQAASNIDVQLKQRADTLHKLVEASKSSVKFEKNLITDVTSLRSVKGYQPGDATTNANISKMDVAQAKILATLENYPKLESTTTIRELMQTADYLEREISATRRVYNASVSQFNGEIYT
jgi:LemA protein